VKPGDRVRVIGRKHPWKGATGRIARAYATPRHDWLLVLDAPYGVKSMGRESCVADRDIEPEDTQEQEQLELPPLAT
jgi:hypothetical protein